MSAADKTPVARPSLSLGDHVYYHQDGKPCHGVVAAVGADGFTTDSEDGEHKVRWNQFLGHRKRAQRRLTIVDRGEDGSIMQDEDGRHLYVHGSLDDHLPEPEEPMSKAMPSAYDAMVKKYEALSAQVQRLAGFVGYKEEV